MLEIEYYENESKKQDGYHYHCAYINTENFNGYDNIAQIETRCETYEEAKNELLNHVVKLRDELNELIEIEGKDMIFRETEDATSSIIGSMSNQSELDFIYPHYSLFNGEWEPSTCKDFASLRKLAMSVVDKIDGDDKFIRQKVNELNKEDSLLVIQCADEIAKVVANYKKQYLESIGRKDIVEAFKM